MPSACVVFRGEVVHSGEVVILVLHPVGRDAVSHLRRSIIIQGGIAGNHTAEQSHVHRRGGCKGVLQFRFILAALHGQLRQSLRLGPADEE